MPALDPRKAPIAAASPTARAERLPALDALRAFALAGVLFANLPLFAGHPYMTEEALAALPTASIDAAAETATRLLVENKFIGLFALLFGAGAGLQLARTRASGRGGAALHLRRMAWLLAIGSLHGWLLWSFDVLRFYALLGLLLPLFARLRDRALLLSGLAFGVVLPAAWRAAAIALGAQLAEPDVLAAFAGGGYADVVAANWAYDWYLTLSPTQGAYQAAVLGRILLGLWLARRLLAAGVPRPASLVRAALWLLPVGLAGSAVHAGLLVVPREVPWRPLVVEAGTLALTFAYLALFLAAWGAGRARRALASLVPVGRMSLTNYLLQTAFGVWLFYGFPPGPGLMGQVGAAALVPIWSAVYASQLALSHLWLRRFAFGPVEWLWRSLTYGAPQTWRPGMRSSLARRRAAPAAT